MAFLDNEPKRKYEVGDEVVVKADAIKKILDRNGLTFNCETCDFVLGTFKKMDEAMKAFRLHAYLKHRDLLGDID